jgi:hypothetical protein
MPLPVIDRPIYKANVLSRSEPISFVPFSVKESKILMMAKESKETESIVDAFKQILRNCLVNKEIDVDQLPMVDLEWLFLNIWARSSGEKTPLFFKCNNKIPVNPPKNPNVPQSEECGMLLEFDIDLLQVPVINKDVNKKIFLEGENIGMVMKLPTFEMTQQLAKSTGDLDIKLAAMCVDYVFDNDTITKGDDVSLDEMINFIESLSQDKYAQVEKFFENCPVIQQKVEKTCSKCGFHHKITLEGLEDFT